MSKVINAITVSSVAVIGTVAAVVFSGQSKRITKLECENKELLNDKNNLLAEINKLEAESNDLNNNILANKYFQEVQRLMKDISDLNKIIKNKEVTILNKQDEINILHKENENLETLLKERSIKMAKEVSDEKEKEKHNLNELNREYTILKERCNQQIEKIRELKTQLREARNEVEQAKMELNDFKNQIKSITNNKVEESEIIKQISRTIDRTSKKISKANNKKKK